MALNEADVRQYYEAILQREPTDAQLAVAMATGTADSLIHALIGSSEAQTFVFPLLQVYQAVFGRVPDAAGLDFWVDQYRGGLSLEAITAGFVDSDEFRATYGEDVTDGSDPAFINQLYRNVLGRDGDPDGLAFWTSQTGISPSEVVRLFAIDAEFTNKAAAPITQFLTDAANGTQDYLGSLFEGFPTIGDTFVLTTGIDVLVGTNDNDTFVAVDDTDGSSAVSTLNLGDDLNGGAGTDTLKLISNNAAGISLAGATLNSIENLEITNVATLTGDIDLNSNAFDSVLIKGLSGDQDVVGVASETAVTIQSNRSADNNSNVDFDTNSATSVTIDNTLQGAGAGSSNSLINFNHDLSAATEVNTTLNAVNMNADASGYSWAWQELDVGGANAAVTANVNVNGATSDGTDYSGADIGINHDGTATVTANINIQNSDSVYAGVYADYASNGSGENDVANVTLSNVKNSSGDSEVYLSDFETINVTVNGDSELDGLYTYSYGTTDFSDKTQTLNIIANANLKIADLDTADDGSNSIVISGSGNVDLGQWDGTYETLNGTTLTSSLDASALTGNLTVEVLDEVNSVKGGSGDDTIVIADVTTFDDAAAGGLKVAGGAGRDTIGFYETDWATIAGGSAAARAGLSGFEVLSIQDALTTATYDVSRISGITSFVAADGVTTAETATVQNLGANAIVTLAGDLATNDGTLVGTLKTDGTSDAVTLVLNTDFADDNNSTAASTGITVTVGLAEVENLTIDATGNQVNTFTPSAGYKADFVTYTLDLANDVIETLTITGDQKVEFSTAATQLDLALIDASANTAGVTIDADLTDASAAALTIKGSATAANTLTGSDNADTIIGGAKADVITGGADGDVLTGGAGNDIFVFNAATDSTLAKMDTITDFAANTYGNGTGGAAGTGAGADATKWTGDVLQFNVDEVTYTKVAVGTYNNATDAQVFIQNTADATTDTFIAALDSSSGKLYLDWNSDGAIDSVIELTGVSSIDAAAFHLV